MSVDVHASPGPGVDRQRALVRALEVINGDEPLEAVLQAVLGLAVDLAGAEYGALGVLGTDGVIDAFVSTELPEGLAEAVGQPPIPGGLIQTLAATPSLTRNVPDTSQSIPADLAAFLGTPVRAGGSVLGALYIADPAADRDGFDRADEELVQAFVLAAGTAIGNARLRRETELQHGWLLAAIEIGGQLAALSGDDAIALLADRVGELTDAEGVLFGVLDPDGRTIEVTAAFGAAAAATGARLEVAGTTTARALEEGRPVAVADLVHAGARPSPLLSVFAAGPVMVIPLVTAGGIPAAIAVLRGSGRLPFRPVELEMAAGFAAHAGVALELAESVRSERNVALLEDRDRIAMDLHDHVIQELFAVGLGLEGVVAELGLSSPVVPRLLQRVDDIDRTIRRIRTSIFELRGSLGAGGGAVRQVVLDIAADLTPVLGFAPQVSFSGLMDVLLDEGMTDDLTACVRETLTNVAKHAAATTVEVDVISTMQELTVLVRDNGRGPGGASRSSGTANLRARAERRGGVFEIEPGGGPGGGGTTARWTIRTT